MKQKSKQVFEFICRSVIVFIFIGTTLALLSGCASAKVNRIGKPASVSTPKPDYIIVEDLVVNPNNITKDECLVNMLGNEIKSSPQNKVEKKIGRKVAAIFTSRLVKNLRTVGIHAYKAIERKPTTKTTLTIKGTFLRIDEGNRTLRVLFGFGIGGGKLEALLGAWQNGKQVAMAKVKTSAGKKPGIAIPIGVGAAVGTLITSTSVSVGSAALDEFMTAIEKDANNAAKEVAKTIAEAYVKRGWLPKENLKKIEDWL